MENITGYEGSIVICNAHIPSDNLEDGSKLYDLTCTNGIIMSIQEAGSHSAQQSGLDPLDTPARAVHKMDVGGGLVLPGLCHAHIHLDKCYLLSQCDELITGDFAEALAVTSKAKSTFPERQDDLYRRGEQLILESVESGVTAMRAHVEVDTTVKMACLDVGLKLKEHFAAISEVQLSVFAQDPLFNRGSDVPGQNYELLALAAARPGVEAVGSAPYVEHSVEAAKKNILLLFQLAEKYSLHLDFHLDYNLDPSSEPLIWFVLDHMRDRIRLGAWRRIQHVCIGHATRLTLWTDDEWTRFSKAVHDDGLPVSLVGLPQSDIYMMGRNVPYPGPPRGTLNAVRLAKEHSLKVALAVNNVGNAFTPQGSPDPLALCALGIALFQVGTRVDCQILLEAVTVNARAAIGQRRSSRSSLVPMVGDEADFVVLHGNDNVQAAACHPSFERTTIKNGRIVARRECRTWHMVRNGAGLR